MVIDEDWTEAGSSNYRSRVPTLVFYGAAPVCAPPVPPPLEPITRRLPVFDVSSSDLELEGEDDSLPERSSRARTERPPEDSDNVAMPSVRGRWLLAAVIARRVVDAAGLLTIGVLLLRGGPKREPIEVTRTTAAAASAPAGPVAPCSLAGPARELAPRALVAGGVEMAPFGDAIAIGYTAGPREGMAMRLDATSLAVATRTKVLAARSIARVVPAPRADKSLDLAADTPDGERTFFDPALGVTYGLGADPTREALRAAPLRGGRGYAIAFRRGGAIWLGVASADGRHALQSAPTHIPGLGTQVGAPTLAVVGDVVVTAWADRARPTDPWSVRWITWKPGETPDEPRVFTPPAGGFGAHAMSPSLASLGAHSFLLAWTEGPVARHQVRAQVMGLDGALMGPALSVSEGTANAGQSQIAVAGAGRGLVAFLASNEGGFAVLGAPLTCTPDL